MYWNSAMQSGLALNFLPFPAICLSLGPLTLYIITKNSYQKKAIVKSQKNEEGRKGRREDRWRESKGKERRREGEEGEGRGREGEGGRLQLIPQENNSLTMVNK